MRNRRVLMQMAGLAPTPYERRLERENRRIIRYANDLQARETLMTMIQRRERGEEGTKAMPFAKEMTDDGR